MKFKVGDLVRINKAKTKSVGCPGYRSAAVYRRNGDMADIRKIEEDLIYRLVRKAYDVGSWLLDPVSDKYFIYNDPILRSERCVTSFVEPEVLLPYAVFEIEEKEENVK